MNSNFLNLNLKDFAKGLVIAVLTALVAYFAGAVQAGTLSNFNLHQIGFAVLTAVIAYLSKNLLSNSNGDPLTPEKA
jgi:hypothetical protein